MKITPFWHLNKSGGIEIDELQLKNFLASLGFSSYALTPEKTMEPQYILKNGNLIEPIIPLMIHSEALKAIESGKVDKKIIPSKKAGKVIDKLLRTKSITKKEVLTLLPSLDKPLLSDTKEAAYFIYRNTAVRVTNDGLRMFPRDQINEYIWKSQIIDRDFELRSQSEIQEGVYYRFLKNVSQTEVAGKLEYDESRFNHLMSILGYMLHGFKDKANPRAVILMDSSTKGTPCGRTGKGLIVDGLCKIRKTIKEDGKAFQDDNRFKFSQVTPDIRILFIDDVKAEFRFENFFSAISEGITVEPKFVNKYFIPFEISPKIIISTNYAVFGHGASHEGRRYEFSLSQYYNEKNTPLSEFGRRFFDEWGGYQWSLFDSLMMYAVQTYLAEGVVESERSTVLRKKLASETSKLFEDWVNSHPPTLNYKHEKKQLYNSFVEYSGSDVFCDQSMFTRYLKCWAELNNLEVDEPRSDDLRFIRFFTK